MQAADIRTRIARYQRLLGDAQGDQRQAQGDLTDLQSYQTAHNHVTSRMEEDLKTRQSYLNQADFSTTQSKIATSLLAGMKDLLDEGHIHLSRRADQARLISQEINKAQDKLDSCRRQVSSYQDTLKDLHRQLVVAEREEALKNVS